MSLCLLGAGDVVDASDLCHDRHPALFVYYGAVRNPLDLLLASVRHLYHGHRSFVFLDNSNTWEAPQDRRQET